MKNKKVILFIISTLLLSLTAVGAGENRVVKATDTGSNLEAKWDWALKSADSQKSEGFYVGYTFSRMMNEHSHFGSIYSDSEEFITLEELITGKAPAGLVKRQTVAQAAQSALEQKKGHRGPGKMVEKKVALLFWYDAQNKGKFDSRKILVSNLESQVKLNPGIIFWLGEAQKDESARFLVTYFKSTPAIKIKKQLVMAVSMHKGQALVFPFLEDVLTGNLPDEIREDAAFWLGEHGGDKALALLEKTARNDGSKKVSEKAVFGIYLVKGQKADDTLIALARKAKDIEIRKKAIFWLGQRAAKHTAQILGVIAKDDPSSDIQKQAVFALSQLDEGKGISQLIKIAKTHSNLKIRKKAIFWLGQSDDPRGLDAIEEILKTR